MDINQTTGTKVPSQEHLNFISELNDTKIPRQSQLIPNRLFMKNFPREVRIRQTICVSRPCLDALSLSRRQGAEIEGCFQAFGAVHDVKIIAKENT